MNKGNSKKKSTVWKHFVIGEENKAQCNHCSRKVSFKSGSTGNLARHLKKKHPEFVLQIQVSHIHTGKDPDPSEDQIASTALVQSIPTSEQVFQTEAQGSHHNAPVVIGYFEEVPSEVNVKHNGAPDTISSNQDRRFMTKRQKLQDERELFISTGEAVDMARKLSSSITTREDIFAKFVASELEDLKKNPVLYTETKVAILDILRNSQLQLMQT